MANPLPMRALSRLCERDFYRMAGGLSSAELLLLPADCPNSGQKSLTPTVKSRIIVYVADVAELADAQASGACGR